MSAYVDSTFSCVRGKSTIESDGLVCPETLCPETPLCLETLCPETLLCPKTFCLATFCPKTLSVFVVCNVLVEFISVGGTVIPSMSRDGFSEDGSWFEPAIKGISVDETEWLDAPFMSWDGLSEDGMSEDGIYEDGMSEDGMSGDKMSKDGSLGASTDRHFLRIPIKNVVSLDRFDASVPITSILTL